MAGPWRIAVHDAGRVAALERAAGVPTVVAQLLLRRGIADPGVAREFLQPKLTGIRHPETLPGLPQAADLIMAAVARRDPIVVFGDYDADGMTASAILLRCLRLLGAEARCYVPHRMDEGYGLNSEALVRLAAEGAKMVITVDNGAAAVAEADKARALGLSLIITDHHQFAARLPDADAIVHPALPGSDYPFHGLCGAGVAFKLAWALCQRASDAKRVGEAMRNFLLQAVGLAAIGAVADVVPLVDENRILVRHGLAALRSHALPGVSALEKVCGLSANPMLDSEDIAFSIAPRLNAAGRLGQAEVGVELLTTTDPQRAAELAAYIDELNQTRQTLERSVLLSAGKQIRERFDPQHESALVLAGRDWHPGVIGIVAGKLAETHNRPVFLASLDELGVKPAVGSGRSASGINLHAALAHCSDLLEGYGGHAAAAGLRISADNIDPFRQRLCEFVRAELGGDSAAPVLDVDAETPLAALTFQTLKQIERLAPFGCGNERPTLCTSGVRLVGEPRRIGGAGRHLSLEVEQHGVRLRGVAFGQGDWEEPLRAARGPLAIAFRPVLNRFRGRATVEMHLRDWVAESERTQA
ncbi:Single-stranded-DNA-specific exonuclease RecJ [Pirellulimonas nuda]|uniref:Single-stranded-DNA-specific exonuclease RecJ n=1 Tax=Pirellulimonas nuda TaxID=2528009 RepID=A0A518DHD7_9BACT|nr:single-stranded-DNA-specific exonuclease RecJ [Pirellulimonas nuda]QDU90886.1 Single-stranded-DNA-specific exonuclease RecJ [Pirellulimonas nuda]